MDLGVSFDSKAAHVEYICSSSYKSLGFVIVMTLLGTLIPWRFCISPLLEVNSSVLLRSSLPFVVPISHNWKKVRGVWSSFSLNPLALILREAFHMCFFYKTLLYRVFFKLLHSSFNCRYLLESIPSAKRSFIHVSY